LAGGAKWNTAGLGPGNGFAVGLPKIGPAPNISCLVSETRWRSLVKTLIYRVVVIALLAVITYALTGNAGETTIITIVFNTSAAVIYYGFERFWDAVSWGKRGFGGGPSEGVVVAFQRAIDRRDAKQGR